MATVAGAAGVTFFQDINVGGSSSAPRAKGRHAWLPADIPNDWVSALKIPAGGTVDACPDANFGGTPWVGSGCNDSFSSLRIR